MSDRVARARTLHIFDLYLFKCRLVGVGAGPDLDLECVLVERVDGGGAVLTFVTTGVVAEGYIIVDDEGHTVTQRFFKNGMPDEIKYAT